MKTKITYQFETKATVKTIDLCNYEIKFFRYCDAKDFHKLICGNNTFRNCFSHIDGVTIHLTTDINVSLSSNNEALSIIVED